MGLSSLEQGSVTFPQIEQNRKSIRDDANALTDLMVIKYVQITRNRIRQSIAPESGPVGKGVRDFGRDLIAILQTEDD